jgi:hypothetical protein
MVQGSNVQAANSRETDKLFTQLKAFEQGSLLFRRVLL